MARVAQRGRHRYALAVAASALVALVVVFFGPYFFRYDAATAACGLNLGGATGGGGTYSVSWTPSPVPGWECHFRPGGAEKDTVEFLPWWT